VMMSETRVKMLMGDLRGKWGRVRPTIQEPSGELTP
jgi:hypothetical protein